MAKAPNWKEEEIEYLKLVWEDMKVSVKDIEMVLKRNRRTISAKARRLGLSRGYNYVFSVDDIEVLRKYYPIMSAKELKDNFFQDKTEEQISNAGYNHGFKKEESYLENKKIEIGIKNLKFIQAKSGKDHYGWVERITIKCDECGKEFERTEARMNSRNYCSKECLAKAKVYLSRGKDNPNWRGGISNLVVFGRSCLLEWKKDSMRNCNYRCIISNSKNFHIHHIKSYQDIFDETLKELDFSFEGENYINYTKEELDLFAIKILENHYKYGLGVCVDKSLHNKFHNNYGRVGFTEENWNEFYNEEILNYR